MSQFKRSQHSAGVNPCVITSHKPSLRQNYVLLKSRHLLEFVAGTIDGAYYLRSTLSSPWDDLLVGS